MDEACDLNVEHFCITFSMLVLMIYVVVLLSYDLLVGTRHMTIVMLWQQNFQPNVGALNLLCNRLCFGLHTLCDACNISFCGLFFFFVFESIHIFNKCLA